MQERYTDILIHIGPRDADGAYSVHARLDDGSGYRDGQMRLNLARLRASEQDPQAFGLELFYALFEGPIRRAYDKVTGRAEAETDGRVRIRLWIDDAAAELQALPWERLYHTHRGQDIAMATSALTPFSRYAELELAEVDPLTHRPLRLLFVVSNPTNLPEGLAPVLVEEEVRGLQEAIDPLVQVGNVRVTIMPGHTGLSEALASALAQQSYRIIAGETSLVNILRQLESADIFHYLGHGHFRRAADSGPGTAALYLEKTTGDFQVARDDELVERLSAVHPLPHLVFLAACESARRDESTEHPFVGLGPKLIQAGVPAVVAMQDVVPMELARKLTGDFYRNLLAHGTVDQALNQARLLLFDREETDWSIPVLFMRLKSGRLFDLSKAKDEKPRLPYEPETVVVPEGKFWMGSDDEDADANERPGHEVLLPSYRIGRRPVTNQEYAAFLQHEKGHEAPRKTGWFLREPPAEKLDHPVVGVSWHDARAYCQWLTRQTGRRYRLPSEAEWEKAARGTDGRQYPWGADWQDGMCNCASEDTTPVGSYPEGASVYGCLDMIGNVQEWTGTLWGSDRKKCAYPYPYRPDDGREDPDADQILHRVYRVHRGGSYADDRRKLACFARGRTLSSSASRERGFRVIEEISETG